MNDAEFTVESRVDRVARQVRARLASLVGAATEEIAVGAGRDAPTDTSSLAQSYYSSHGGESGYAAAAERAAEVNPHAVIVPEAPAPGSDLEGVAASAVQHALFVELGTVKAAAQPHFYPAVDAVKATLPERIAAAVREGAER